VVTLSALMLAHLLELSQRAYDARLWTELTSHDALGRYSGSSAARWWPARSP
jgi:hypothetical protein